MENVGCCFLVYNNLHRKQPKLIQNITTMIVRYCVLRTRRTVTMNINNFVFNLWSVENDIQFNSKLNLNLTLIYDFQSEFEFECDFYIYCSHGNKVRAVVRKTIVVDALAISEDGIPGLLVELEEVQTR